MPDSKQDAICEQIMEMIENGEIAVRIPSAGILAAKFGVNARTVGKAISRLAKSGTLRKRRGLGAFVREERKLSLLIRCPRQSFDTGSYYSEIFQGVMAANANCKLLVSPNEDDCDFNNCDGAIFLGQNEYESYTKLDKAGIPFVVIEDHPDPKIASVGADIHRPVYRAIRKLLEMGLTRIAYIGMTTSRMLFTDVEKFRAYIEAVDDVTHTVDFSLVRHAWPLPEYFYEQFRDMLRKSGPPHVVFITTDFAAPGIYRAAAEAGYKIPEHIQVLSCDNLSMGLSPKPASFEVPKRELGAKAIETLLKLIASPGSKRVPKIKLPCEFVPGPSLPSLLPQCQAGMN